MYIIHKVTGHVPSRKCSRHTRHQSPTAEKTRPSTTPRKL